VAQREQAGFANFHSEISQLHTAQTLFLLDKRAQLKPASLNGDLEPQFSDSNGDATSAFACGGP
jgi:hypothetical protein